MTLHYPTALIGSLLGAVGLYMYGFTWWSGFVAGTATYYICKWLEASSKPAGKT